MRALVIDDSKFQRLSMQRALNRAGYEVVTANDGESGLLAAQEARPDVIVLDMLLPKISGVEVLRTLRREKNTSAIPVIVLTGLCDKNRDKLLAEGATDFLAKSEVMGDGDCGRLVAAMAQLRPSEK
jgi:twitching motility two-component system response regulator PilH